jgi:hypothetical protein
VSWARIDDGFAEHPKIRKAWRTHPRAVGLFAMAIAYSARYETDGRIDPEWVEEKLPVRAERTKVVRALVDVGLIVKVGDGFEIHDYLVYNRSRVEAEQDREQARARQQRWRDQQHERAGSNGKPRRRQSKAERATESRQRDFAWCEEHVPDLPVSLAASALSVARLNGNGVTPEGIRARVLASHPDLKAGS